MNQTLSISRLLQLIHKQWGDNSRLYVMGLAISIGIVGCLYLFNVFMNRDLFRLFGSPLRPILYFAGLFVAGCIFAGVYFSDLSSKPKAINSLLLPASNTEKTIVAILFSVVLFFTFYTALFVVLDAVCISIAKVLPATAHRQAITPEQATHIHLINMFDGAQQNVIALSIYFALQSLFLLGSVYFEKFGYLKTALSLILVIFLFVLYVAEIGSAFLPHGGFSDSFNEFRIYEDGYTQVVPIPAVLSWLVRRGIYLLTAATWVALWFRLKEKEV